MDALFPGINAEKVKVWYQFHPGVEIVHVIAWLTGRSSNLGLTVLHIIGPLKNIIYENITISLSTRHNVSISVWLCCN
jgi:hypothetical protein